MRRLLSGALLTALALGAAACGGAETVQPSGPAPAAQHTIRIGAAISFSGPLAYQGKRQMNGYNLWRDKVNAAGGLDLGGVRYTIAPFDFVDDKGDNTTAANAVEKLVTEDRVDFLFGPFGSGMTAASSAVSEKYHRIMLAPTANADTVYSRGFHYLFGILPPASRGVPPELDALEAASGGAAKTLAIIYPDDLFNGISAEATRKYAQSLGYDVVYFGKYPKDSTDLTPILTQVKGLSPDALIDVGYYQDEVMSVKQAHQLRLDLKFFGTLDLPYSPGFDKDLGALAEGVVGMTWFTPDAGFKDALFGSSRQYAAAYKQKYGEDASYYDAAATAAGEVLGLAVSKAGDLDADKVAAALHAETFQTFFGPIHYAADGHNDAGGSTIGQVQGGQTVIVWPEQIRQQPLVYPKPAWK